MDNSFYAEDLTISGPRIITPFYVEDKRGGFLKYYEKDMFLGLGIKGNTYEDFESYSRKGVIRGLHFQLEEPQEKIVHVVSGSINDVIVDLRKDSTTFGKHISIELSSDNHKILYIPKGFAHGFEVTSDYAIMSYKCLGKYIKGVDTGIHFKSPELGITWKSKEPIVSEKDQNLMSFRAFCEKYGCLAV